MRHTILLALGSATAIAIVALAAMYTAEPMLMPPLGATAFVCFHKPDAPAAKPHVVILSHFIGIVCGVIGLAAAGLLSAPSVSIAGVGVSRVAAVAMALGLTCGAMNITKMLHPPAGATTLVVSMGLIVKLEHLMAFEAGAILMVVCAWLINRLSGNRGA